MSQRVKIKALLASEQTDKQVTVKGWVRAFRSNRFIALNDGSTNNNIQIVVDFENTDPALLKRITFGAAIAVTGNLAASLGQGQSVEIIAGEIKILGDCDPLTYPLQPKKQSLEFLRENAHLRFRTSLFGSIFRVRNTLSFAVHQFFQEKGFVYLHTPIITQSDAEGAGEAFRVTTLDFDNLPKVDDALKSWSMLLYTHLELRIKDAGFDIEEINKELSKVEHKLTLRALCNAVPKRIKVLAPKAINKKLPLFNRLVKELAPGFIEDLQMTYIISKPNINLSEYIEALTENYGENLECIVNNSFFTFTFYNIKFIHDEYFERYFKEDFFGKSTNLTVSGQLEGELGAMALSDIYTFGPTFRAENSNTTRHLAEFWMIEPEMAFYDINENADLAEELLKYVISVTLFKNKEDLAFLSQRLFDEEKQKPQNERSELTLLDKLQFCLDNDFERLTYTEAIDILKESTPNKKKKFQYPVEGWGTDLQSEHERYLVEKHFKKPVILTDYPKEIKSFYMRQNDDGKTVAAMDILFPGIGEIIGGSQREERLDKLIQRMDEMGIPTKELDWYLDTRRFGACPHAGFGLGFERLVLFVTGMGNIRDVIPFPRYPKNAEF